MWHTEHRFIVCSVKKWKVPGFKREMFIKALLEHIIMNRRVVNREGSEYKFAND